MSGTTLDSALHKQITRAMIGAAVFRPTEPAAPILLAGRHDELSWLRREALDSICSYCYYNRPVGCKSQTSFILIVSSWQLAICAFRLDTTNHYAADRVPRPSGPNRQWAGPEACAARAPDWSWQTSFNKLISGSHPTYLAAARN